MPTSYEINREPFQLKPQPYIFENNLMVPLRAFATGLGASVAWDEASASITLKTDAGLVRFSLAEQSMYLDGKRVEPLLLQIDKAGTTYCSLEPLARALGAGLVQSKEGRLSLYSKAYAGEGVLQLTLLGSKNIILQNDTDKALDLGSWALVSLEMFSPKPLEEFRFPAGFTLAPGQGVQVMAAPPVEPDGKNIFKFEETDRGPAHVQIMFRQLDLGQELINVNALEGDLYVGNWRLLAPGKPLLNLPAGLWVPGGSGIGIKGSPGPPTSPLEISWPNLPQIEEAYREAEKEKTASKEAALALLEEQYQPVMASLGLDSTLYCVSSTQHDYDDFNSGHLAPFAGDALASRSLLQAEWALTRPLVRAGDYLPICLIERGGQEAYVALLKADGSQLAYHLQLALDDGYYSWDYRQVLPK